MSLPEPPHGIKTLLALHGINWKDVEEVTIDWHIQRGMDVKVRHKPDTTSVYVEFSVPDKNMKLPDSSVDGESH